MQLMDDHVEDFRFGRTLTNALRIVNAEQEAAWNRVLAARERDKAPVVVVPKSCKRCYGTGQVPVDALHGAFNPEQLTGYKDCPDCGGTGTRMPA